MTFFEKVKMDEPLYSIPINDLNHLEQSTKQKALTSLESGKVIYFPSYTFKLNANEQCLLSESVLAPNDKNVSYDYQRQRLSRLNPAAHAFDITPAQVQQFMHRYALYAKEIIDRALPQYSNTVRWGRTSFRPAEIKGRSISKHKDDTRLHVDAFPSTAVNDHRILRVFCNINPDDKPRVWHIGEPFEKVLETFASSLPSYNALIAKLLKWVKATRNVRSAYDHYMLKLHNAMKLDDNYQQQVHKHKIDFPPESTWIVFTDHVSHAALSGQFLLEQTFYLPVAAMENPAASPLKQWEKLKARTLV